MAIKAPKWVAQMKAYPTAGGWVVDKPKGRTELIKSATFSAAEIAEWHAAQGAAPAPAPKPQTLHEAPVEEKPLSDAEIEYHYGSDAEETDDTDI